jgi:hypothetical protein
LRPPFSRDTRSARAIACNAMRIASGFVTPWSTARRLMPYDAGRHPSGMPAGA